MIGKKAIFAIAAFLVLFAGAIYLISSKGSGKTKDYGEFAQCLKDKGLVFYGAFWCPHCQSQKKAFGDAAKILPYVECSTPDGQGQLDVCKEKGINSYPTWTFPDGTKLEGEITFETLSQKSSCQLPQ